MSSFIDEMMGIIKPPPQGAKHRLPREPYQHDMPHYYIATFKDGTTEVIEHLPTWCESRNINISSVSRVVSGHRTHTKGIRFKKIMRD